LKILKKKDTKDCKFDKDNPIHIEVITAMATIKCENFNIEFVNKDFFRIQRIAGHITPSLIVTSAISASLMCLNLYSIALEKNGIKTTYKNYNGDLSCSFILDKNLVMVNKKEIPKLELSHNIKLDDVVNELTHQKILNNVTFLESVYLVIARKGLFSNTEKSKDEELGSLLNVNSNNKLETCRACAKDIAGKYYFFTLSCICIN